MRRRHRQVHRALWLLLALLLPAAVIVPLALRPSGPLETAPEQLMPPK